VTIRDFVEKHSANAVIAALIGSLFGNLFGLGGIAFTYYSNISSQNKQIKTDALARFDQSTGSIIMVGGEFISAINNAKDLAKEKEKVKALAATQIGETENLRKFFPYNNDLTAYEDVLAKFSDVADKTSDATQMKAWAESFGNVIDSKSNLSRALYTKVGG
jgi:hypothetical protein